MRRTRAGRHRRRPRPEPGLLGRQASSTAPGIAVGPASWPRSSALASLDGLSESSVAPADPADPGLASGGASALGLDLDPALPGGGGALGGAIGGGPRCVPGGPSGGGIEGRGGIPDGLPAPAAAPGAPENPTIECPAASGNVGELPPARSPPLAEAGERGPPWVGPRCWPLGRCTPLRCRCISGCCCSASDSSFHLACAAANSSAALFAEPTCGWPPRDEAALPGACRKPLLAPACPKPPLLPACVKPLLAPACTTPLLAPPRPAVAPKSALLVGRRSRTLSFAEPGLEEAANSAFSKE
mmetsp:Transcript_50615/g.144653  ORF Transcript_50615/g.144653 Transcript_50615/m.144653 type:complete len:300 (-) Transcript_50615:127-1026(-)